MIYEWGPVVTFEMLLIASMPVFLACWFWFKGHILWLIVNDIEMSVWLVSYLEKHSTLKSKEEIRLSLVYISKGIGWSIMTLWMYVVLVVSPAKNEPPYRPVFGNVTLLHLGIAGLSLIVFLAFTIYFRIVARKKG